MPILPKLKSHRADSSADSKHWPKYPSIQGRHPAGCSRISSPDPPAAGSALSYTLAFPPHFDRWQGSGIFCSMPLSSRFFRWPHRWFGQWFPGFPSHLCQTQSIHPETIRIDWQATILGVSGLVEMMNHLKDNLVNVIGKFREKLKGTSGEYERLQREIQKLDGKIAEYVEKIAETQTAIETTERTVESTQKTLNDNRKVEEEFFAASFLPEFEALLERVDLEGKDIPGVTVDTLEYLLDIGECICGTKLTEHSEAYEAIMKLKKQVPPEMLGGAAGKLKATLEAWQSETNELRKVVLEKAEGFDVAQGNIDDLQEIKKD